MGASPCSLFYYLPFRIPPYRLHGYIRLRASKTASQRGIAISFICLVTKQLTVDTLGSQEPERYNSHILLSSSQHISFISGYHFFYTYLYVQFKEERAWDLVWPGGGGLLI